MTTDSQNTDAAAVDEVGGWPELLRIVSDSDDLTRQQAGAAMTDILAGRATSAQIAGLIVAMRVKGESVDEMTGMAEAMLAASEPLNVSDRAIDIVGTGGSVHRQKHALNVSTMASFVAAGAGATVCKHGNFKASSTSGAFDFLGAVGVSTDITAAQLEECVATTGIGFALARAFHPAMRHAGPVRAELGIPTVFNVLGPLAHPGRLKRQLVGTPNEQTAERMAAVLHALGSEHAWVVTGAGGLDEISTTGPSVIFEVRPDGIERMEIDLRFLGVSSPASLDELAGGSAEENAQIFDRILSGEEAGPRADIVALNAGAALVVADVVPDLASGLAAARAAIADGRARATLDSVVAATNA